MHELGVMDHIVKIAEKHAKANGAMKVIKLVIQIGQLSAVVPDAARMCYPVVIHDTMLEEAELVIEEIPANGLCKQCDAVYNLIENEFKCPKCGGEQWEILSGRELLIKEIQVI